LFFAAQAQRTLAERRYKDSVAAVQRAEKLAYMTRLHAVATDSARKQLAPLYTIKAGTAGDSKTWFISKPVERSDMSGEAFFYILSGLLLILGLIRKAFPKYFADLFSLFFRVTFRQQSIRDQLLQNAWPSLLLNILFFFSGGLFLTLLSQYYGWQTTYGFWYSLLFWAGLLLAIYGLKLIAMQALSWLFHLREAGKTYSFVVFLINKVMGVVLLPFIIFLGLGPASWKPVVVTLAFIVLAGLFLYRYTISYPSVKNTVKLNRFHFIIYLWALEIVPLLLIYKGMALQLSKN
jgi:hypothetical protein